MQQFRKKNLNWLTKLAKKKSKANVVSADNNDDMDVVLTNTLNGCGAYQHFEGNPKDP